MLIHAGVYSAWPNMQAVASKPIVIDGELQAPEIHEPPPIVEPIIPAPKITEPIPPAPKPEVLPQKKPDTGVALPVLAEKSETASNDANDYVVAEVAPLNVDDKLPFGSKTGATPLNQYTPGDESSGANDDDIVDQDALAGFGQHLQALAAKTGSYPLLASKRGWQGRIKVMVRFARNGTPYQVGIKEPSRHEILNERALEMVKHACTSLALPEALIHKAFSVVVPVEFKLQ